MRVVKNYMGMMQQIVSSSTTFRDPNTKLWFKKIDENSGPRTDGQNQFLKQFSAVQSYKEYKRHTRDGTQSVETKTRPECYDDDDDDGHPPTNDSRWTSRAYFFFFVFFFVFFFFFFPA